MVMSDMLVRKVRNSMVSIFISLGLFYYRFGR